jgi:UDP:flavonoid glycosyltransferase YjiC (YdhE family)
LIGRWHSLAVEVHADLWRQLGREPNFGLAVFPSGYLDQIPGPLQAEGIDRPSRRMPIRPVPWSEPLGPLPPWIADRQRRVVFLTLGTLAYGAVDVLRRAIEEIAVLDVDILVAVGPDGDVRLLGPLPENVHAERFVPQAAVLPLVDLVIHHGGTGTMLGAAVNGLPQLIMPQAADQFINARSVESAGIGRVVRNDRYRPGMISQAARALLESGEEATRSQQLAEVIAAMPAPAEVVAALARGPE